MRPLLWIASLALNVALAAGLLLALTLPHREADPTPGDPGDARQPQGEEAYRRAEREERSRAAARDSADEPRMPLPPEIEGDYDSVVARLSDEGWPLEEAQKYALGAMMVRFGREMFGRQPQDDYWSNAMTMHGDPEQRRRMAEQSRAMEAAMADIFGRSLSGRHNQWSTPIPEASLEAARQIERDYQELQMEIHMANQGIMLPEDQEALALLKEERRRDLEELLSPEELFEYEVRHSDIANGLRHRLRSFEPSEEEFREIFRMELESERARAGGDAPAAEEANERKNQALREAIGEERFKEYQRSSDYSYTSLVNIAQRLDIPREHVNEAYELKEVVEAAQRDLRSDRDITAEERSEAMRALGEETTEALKELLGERGFEAYRQQGGHWLHQLR